MEPRWRRRGGTSRAGARIGTLLAAAVLALAAATATGASCPGQCQTLSGNPLVVKHSADTALQVFYAGDADGQVFSPRNQHGNAGTYIAVDGQLFGPTGGVSYTEISQSAVSGNGTAATPFTSQVVVGVGSTGLRITETVSLVANRPYFRIDRRIDNLGAAPKAASVFQYADLYLRGSDRGFGYFDPATGAIGGQTPTADFFQIFMPITPGSRYEEGGYSAVFARMSGVATGGPPLANTFLPPPDAANIVDNGAALQWGVQIPPGGSATVSSFWSFGTTPQIPGRTDAPDLGRTIPNPQTIRSGPARVTAPRRVSLRSLRRSRCVLTRVVSVKRARVLVTIFSGIRSRRLFGADLVTFRRPGRKTVCIPVPLRARTFNARTRLRVAVGVALGAVDVVGQPRQRRLPPVIRPIDLVP